MVNATNARSEAPTTEAPAPKDSDWEVPTVPIEQRGPQRRRPELGPAGVEEIPSPTPA